MIELVKKKNLDLKLTKVKAHSNDPYNDEADALAKGVLNLPAIEWKDLTSYKIPTEIKWKDKTLDDPIRQFIKKINSKTTVYQWTAQNRTEKKWSHQIKKQQEYTWDLV